MEILKILQFIGVILMLICFLVVCIGTTIILYHKFTGKTDYSSLEE